MESQDNTGLLEYLLGAAREAGLDLDPDSALLDIIGWDFRVLHGTDSAGRHWIVRAPKRQDMAKRVQSENNLLSLVRNSFPADIPDWVVYTDKIVAYPRLPGEPAANEDIRTRVFVWRINQSEPPERYIETLAACITSIQGTDIDKAAVTGIPVTAAADLRSRLGTKLSRAIDEIGVHESWRVRCRKWIDADELWPTQTALVHGDIHPGHTLVDETGAIVGLIDWTDAEVGDPALEFIGACRRFDSAMLDRLLAAYERQGGITWKGLRRHIDESIAFAPMFTGLYALDFDQPTYVQVARDVLGRPAE